MKKQSGMQFMEFLHTLYNTVGGYALLSMFNDDKAVIQCDHDVLVEWMQKNKKSFNGSYIGLPGLEIQDYIFISDKHILN